MLHWFLLGIVLASPAFDAPTYMTETSTETHTTATEVPKPTEAPIPTELPKPTEVPVPTEMPTEAPTPSPTESPTATYASKSGVPSILAVTLSCIIGLVIVLASTMVLCIMKPPENDEGWGSTQPLIIKQDF